MVTNTAEWKMDLLLDGYISYTLTPRYTEKYLKLFIKCLEKERGGTFVPFHNGWVVARPTTAQQQRGVTTGPMQRLDDEHDANFGYEIFDRKVDLGVGTIVPQPTWIGVTEKTGVLCPIFFVRTDGTLGVPYEYPAPVPSTLHNATAPAPALLKRSNQNMRMRIQWPGYEEFHYEFRIQDRKLGEQVPINMSRLVERLMRGIHRLFLEEEGNRNPQTFQERWKLGEGGIQPQEINLIGVLHISKGTWMPILQLAQHIIPRWDWGHESQTKQPEED